MIGGMIPILAYVGPETVVPITSALAAIGGVLLMGWRTITGAIVGCARKLCGRKSDLTT